MVGCCVTLLFSLVDPYLWIFSSRPGPVPPIPGPPPLDAVRGPRCDLTMPCMLFDTFQRLGTGFQRRDRPAPVETKEKLLLTDGRERWLVVGSLCSFPL